MTTKKAAATAKATVKPRRTSKAAASGKRDIEFLPLRDVIVFPGVAVPLQVSRRKSCDLLEKLPSDNFELAVFTQLESELDDPGSEDFHPIGCLVTVIKKIKFPDGSLRLIVQGLDRVALEKVIDTKETYKARVSKLKETKGNISARERQVLAKLISSNYQKILSLMPEFPEELQISILNIEDSGKLADFIASTLNFSLEEKRELLGTHDLSLRLKTLLELVQRELEMAELGNKIQGQVQSQVTQAQKNHFLREQMRIIRRELGDQTDETVELDQLTQKVKAIGLDQKLEKETLKEISRLEHMPPGSSESGQLKTWVEWVTELPWNQLSEDALDLKKARRVLDADHAHLEKVKERILEFLAVRKLKKDHRGTVLCFSGPPGVGKTSLGRSIAKAMGREFVRMSVGGVHDESEIRGHRRTYIGAMPGRILKELKRCQVRNPVFMLDEVDKISHDYRGDPASALLEVLDSEQNHTFQDNYLNFPFDLSEVFFICTVNRLDTIPQALRDRLEVIHLEGYTLNEKADIGRKHLFPEALKDHGLTRQNLSIDKKTLESLISDYTRESGVRQLKKRLATLCRKAARRKVEGKRSSLKVQKNNLKKLLDRESLRPEVVRQKSEIGVATGMAWTPTGGALLNIEAALIEGRRPILVTGSLGDVMKESARIAYTLVRRALSKSSAAFDKKEIHIHVPAGAIPKDGPSAGITIVAALMSLMRRRPLNPKVAMSGEVTLTGKVLPVGGIKSKVLAAERAGAKEIILPKDNKDNLEDIPKDIQRKLKFHWVSEIKQVYSILGLLN